MEVYRVESSECEMLFRSSIESIPSFRKSRSRNFRPKTNLLKDFYSSLRSYASKILLISSSFRLYCITIRNDLTTNNETPDNETRNSAALPLPLSFSERAVAWMKNGADNLSPLPGKSHVRKSSAARQKEKEDDKSRGGNGE